MNKYHSIKKASIIGIICNIFLFIIKIIVGLFTHSAAMLADAYNSASDIVSSLFTFIGNKISSKPRDKDHNLGHGKAEYIFSLLISFIMIELGLSIIKDSCFNIFNDREIIFSYFLIIVSLTTIITKFILFIYTNKIAKKYDNILMKANALDHRNDVVLTTFNLISGLFLMNGISIVDSIVGIIIGIWIIKQAAEIFIHSYDVLMDKSIDQETKDKVMEIIKRHEEIKRINHFNSTPVGYRYQISFTIFVDGKMSTYDSHKIANEIEDEIEKEIKEVYLTVIHVNPM